MNNETTTQPRVPTWAIEDRNDDPMKAIEFAAALSETFKNPDMHTPELDAALAPEWSKQ